jgi:hypothetical protein
VKRSDGRVVGQIASVRDVTDRKQTQIALREPAQRSRTPRGQRQRKKSRHFAFRTLAICKRTPYCLVGAIVLKAYAQATLFVAFGNGAAIAKVNGMTLAR